MRITLSTLILAGGLGCCLPAIGQSVFAPPPDAETGKATPPITPPMADSNEASKEQLELARAQGTAQSGELTRIMARVQGEHLGTAGETRAGAFRLGYTLTRPEGSWRFSGGQLTWQEPAPDATAHLRIFAMDAGDGRLVPALVMRATLTDEDRHTEAATALPFAWYPLLNGYGTNLSNVAGGTYTLRLEIEPPAFHRHDPHNGYRFQNTVVAVIPGVHVNPAALGGAPSAVEAEETHLDETKPEAEALRRTLANMYKTAIEGRDVRSGDYIVANANEFSEAYWYFQNGHFVLATEMENSTQRNSHIEVAVMDALTGRFVPGLQVTASLTDSSGHNLGTRTEPFMWHPWLWHYGENWRIPHNGEYRVHVHFDAPDFARYGHTTGDIMKVPVDMDFDGQKLISGEK